MRFQTLGAKADFLSPFAKATEAIPQGSVVCLAANGTNDGLAIALPSTAGADHAHGLAFGVACDAMASGSVGRVRSWGYCAKAKFAVGRTRSATDANWPTFTSIAALVNLQIDTINNAFGSSVGSQAASAFLPAAVLMESISSFATEASTVNTAATATISYVTSLRKVFLRMM